MKRRIRWENKNFDDMGTFTLQADSVHPTSLRFRLFCKFFGDRPRSMFTMRKELHEFLISMHACDPVPIVMGLRLAAQRPPELRY